MVWTRLDGQGRAAHGVRQVNLAHVGTPVGPMTRVHGKSSHRMWRLETDQGVFAVKELRPDRAWTYRHD